MLVYFAITHVLVHTDTVCTRTCSSHHALQHTLTTSITHSHTHPPLPPTHRRLHTNTHIGINSSTPIFFDFVLPCSQLPPLLVLVCVWMSIVNKWQPHYLVCLDSWVLKLGSYQTPFFSLYSSRPSSPSCSFSSPIYLLPLIDIIILVILLSYDQKLEESRLVWHCALCLVWARIPSTKNTAWHKTWHTTTSSKGEEEREETIEEEREQEIRGEGPLKCTHIHSLIPFL